MTDLAPNEGSALPPDWVMIPAGGLRCFVAGTCGTNARQNSYYERQSRADLDDARLQTWALRRFRRGRVVHWKKLAARAENR